MDKTRRLPSCAVIATSSSSGNVVLVCGGYGRSDCEIYDPSTDSWTNGPSLPSTLHGSAALQGAAMVTAAPNSVYDVFILGGYDAAYSNKIYAVKDLNEITLVGTFETGRAWHVALKNNFC